jgi:FHS family L-fucose permease-like MFS transporter
MSKAIKHKPYALFLIFILFFIWGAITAVNDVLIKYFKDNFELSDFQSLLIQFAFFGAYGLGALSYYLYSKKFGDPINKLGYKKGITAGLMLAGLGCLSFYPTILIGNYYIILVSFFIIGLGLTLLQISCNPYVAIMGTPQSASSRLNMAQGFNSLGTTLGPLIGGFVIFNFLEGNTAIQLPYLICGGLLFLFAFIIQQTELPSYKSELKSDLSGNALQFKHLRLGMLAIFFYVGAEVALSSKLFEFAQLPSIGGASDTVATDYIALYWGGAMIGRLLNGILGRNEHESQFSLAKIGRGLLTIAVSLSILIVFIALKNHVLENNQIFSFSLLTDTFVFILPFLYFVLIQFTCMLIFGESSAQLLTVFATICMTLIISSYAIGGNFALWAIIAIGLFNSIMWSNIFTLSIARLKEYTSQGSSLLIIMIVGGAILPLIMGLISDAIDLRTAFLFPIISYLYIFYFGKFGYKAKQKDVYE